MEGSEDEPVAVKKCVSFGGKEVITIDPSLSCATPLVISAEEDWAISDSAETVLEEPRALHANRRGEENYELSPSWSREAAANDEWSTEASDTALGLLKKIDMSMMSFAEEQREISNVLKEVRRDLLTSSAAHVGMTQYGNSAQHPVVDGEFAKVTNHVSANSDAQISLDAKWAEWPGSLEIRPELKSATSMQKVLFHASSVGQARLKSNSSSSFAISGGERGQALANKRTCIVLPDSRLRITLDVLAACMLAWDFAVAPVQIAWNRKMDDWTFAVSIFISTFWTLDCLPFSFVSAYYTEAGELVTDSKKIATRYLRRQFAIDVLIVALDWFTILAGTAFRSLNMVRVVKITRVVRLVKLVRVKRVGLLLEYVTQAGRVGPAALEAIKILVVGLYLVHFLACAWFIIGSNTSSDTGMTWIGAVWAEGGLTFAESGEAFQYCSSLHWTLTTMLSGTSIILPLNSVELTFGCLCILLGVCGQVLLISELSSLAVESRERSRHQAYASSSLRKFCSKHIVRVELWSLAQSLVQTNFVQTNARGQRVNDVQSLQIIPPKLRTWILHDAFRPHLSYHPMLLLWSATDSRLFSKPEFDALDFLYVEDEHSIFTSGDVAFNIYLLVSGHATYSKTQNSSNAVTDEQIEVEVDTWMCEPGLWTQWVHVGTLEAGHRCEMCYLKLDIFFKLLPNADAFFTSQLREYAILYHKALANSVPPLATWPDDVHVSGTTFAQVTSAMSSEARETLAFLTMHVARELGVLNEAQAERLDPEIGQGKAFLFLHNTGSLLTLERLVCVPRVILKRNDGLVLFEIAERSCDDLRVTCRFPGSKLRIFEDIHAATNRLISRLTRVVGEIEILRVEEHEQAQVSRKVLLPTRYSYHDLHCKPCEIDTRPSAYSVTSSVSFRSHASNEGRRRRLSKWFDWNAAFQIIAQGLENKILKHRESEVTIVEDETNGELFACMWLSEEELDYLATPEGRQLMESMLPSVGLSSA